MTNIITTKNGQKIEILNLANGEEIIWIKPSTKTQIYSIRIDSKNHVINIIKDKWKLFNF